MNKEITTYLSKHYKTQYLNGKSDEQLKELYTKNKLIDSLKNLGVYKSYMKKLNIEQLQTKYNQSLINNYSNSKIDVKQATIVTDNLFLNIMQS